MDLAGLCLKAGVKNLNTVFLMTDAQVADEKFLVLINDLLASGKKLLALEYKFHLASESSQGAPRSRELGHRNRQKTDRVEDWFVKILLGLVLCLFLAPFIAKQTVILGLSDSN